MRTQTSSRIPSARRLAPSKRSVSVVDSGVSQGAELVGGVVVFLLIGFGLDAWLGTTPVFMIVLTVFAVVGQFVKIYFTYSHEMERLEAERSRSAGGARQ